MPEAPLVKHVKRHGCVRNFFFRGKSKSRFGIDESSNQPGGRGAVDTGSRPRNPDPAFVVTWIDLGRLRLPRGHPCGIGLRQQLPRPFLQRTLEEIHLDNLLEAAPEPAQPPDGLLLGWQRRKFIQLPDQLLVFSLPRFRKAPDQLRRRDIVNRLHANDGSIAPVFPNGSGQPLKALFIHRIAG